MTIAALRAEMKDGFKRVEDEFATVHAELTTMRDEFAAVHAEFGTVHAELTSVRDEFAAVHAEFTAVREEIGRSADDTRRYFQMLAEQMRDSVAIVAEGTAHNTSRLDDHERRLKAIEKLRRS
jgi:uncharacterized coiled-coil DUF342 family protein